ncbi:HAD family hydrolase [Nocardioides rubriscoriae]|uniref:HAD family hydrolase n=1 Tax=Nocardioides rubriscoriae TaxID=642762 RepID=UPI0011DF346B|nr:HAD family hydrolase [Nocardioides rubriscoriae]
MPDTPPAPDTVVLDLDGTLVDSVPVHVLAWQAAFRDVGLHVPSHRLHGLIGMGGDRLVAAAAGDAVEHALGDELRARHPQQLDGLFGRIVPTEGAAELLETLRERGCTLVLASSSDADLTDRLLDVLGEVRHLLGDLVTGSDAEQSKPSGELVAVALENVDAGRAVVVGDSVWDVAAARDAGVPCVALLTGGVGEAELRDAGAVAAYDSPAALAEHLRRTGSLVG